MSVLALTIATTLVGFAAGAYAAFRFVPPLARTPGSVAVGLLVCGLVGAATGLACLYVYLTIYALAQAPGIDAGLQTAGGAPVNVSPDANIFVEAVYSIVSESGVLLALAAVVYLLARPHVESAR